MINGTVFTSPIFTPHSASTPSCASTLDRVSVQLLSPQHTPLAANCLPQSVPTMHQPASTQDRAVYADDEGPHMMCGVSADPADEYEILEQPMGTPRQLRVITIGAGASGLNLAYQIERHMEHIEHIIYEKNAEVGGTWYENRYPGCACDIPSHNYQFTWKPNPSWKQLYVGDPGELISRLLTELT